MKNLVFLIAFTVLIKPILPVFEYLINYDYIRTELCINRAKPELKCNGKCHLMKELAAASEKEKPVSQDKKSVGNEINDLFFYEFQNLSIGINISKEYKSNFRDTLDYDFSVIAAIFHPPTVIC